MGSKGEVELLWRRREFREKSSNEGKGKSAGKRSRTQRIQLKGTAGGRKNGVFAGEFLRGGRSQRTVMRSKRTAPSVCCIASALSGRTGKDSDPT